ncbi:MAG: hypothetical protein ACTSVY_05535 [Candidatus Helarchaeota archaeon]
MIKELWILEKMGGRCIFTKSYSDLETDPDLLSSFLSALYTFSEEVSGESGKGIESIEMGGFKWVYIEVKNLLFICAATKSDATDMIKAKINTIKNKFIEMHPDVDQDDFHDKFDGNVSQFEDFEAPLIELTEDWKKVDKVTSAAELMDIIEVFQQLFHFLSKTAHSIKGRENFLDKKMLLLKEVLPQSLSDATYGEFGWDLLGINVFKHDIDEKEFREGLYKILRFYCEVLLEVFGKEIYLKIASNLIFPYIKKDWERIKKLRLDEIIINLFLVEGVIDKK